MSHPDLQGADDDLVAYADAAAADLRQRFEKEPEGEFVAWLKVALEREAMVGEAYDPTHLQKHLDRLLVLGVDLAVVELLRKTIGHVWAQEEGHTARIRAMLQVIAPPDDFLERIGRGVLEVFGTLQGQITSRLTSPSAIDRALAVAAVSVGQRFNKVPPFIRELRAAEFPPFCAVNAALEQTAITGYERLSELAWKLRNEELLSGTTVDVDLHQIEADERYHEAVFRGFSGWEIRGGQPDSPPDPNAPLEAPPFSVEAHGDVMRHARQSAYHTDAPVAGGLDEATIDLEALRRDPLLQYLHAYVRTFARMPQSEESRHAARRTRGEPAGV